jgi:hypothetical protein
LELRPSHLAHLAPQCGSTDLPEKNTPSMSTIEEEVSQKKKYYLFPANVHFGLFFDAKHSGEMSTDFYGSIPCHNIEDFN